MTNPESSINDLPTVYSQTFILRNKDEVGFHFNVDGWGVKGRVLLAQLPGDTQFAVWYGPDRSFLVEIREKNQDQDVFSVKPYPIVISDSLTLGFMFWYQKLGDINIIHLQMTKGA